MNTKDEQIVSFVFKRSGKDRLKESELYLILSMDLKWCSPKNAKEFIAHLIAKDLLQKEGDSVVPAFDVQDVVIPLGFHPQKEDFERIDSETLTDSFSNSAFEHCIERLQKERPIAKANIEKEIGEIMKEKQVHAEAAIVLFAGIHNVDVSDLIPALRQEILRENTG
ncbi:MAG: DUF2240 family protein [Candidatus Thermoplasmatota archaeon]|nr:DUF2240 family protein [Candidatus Thermoplasmatota archaeon]